MKGQTYIPTLHGTTQTTLTIGAFLLWFQAVRALVCANRSPERPHRAQLPELKTPPSAWERGRSNVLVVAVLLAGRRSLSPWFSMIVVRYEAGVLFSFSLAALSKV